MNPLFRRSVATILCGTLLAPSSLLAATATPPVHATAAAKSVKAAPAMEAQVELLRRLARLSPFASLGEFAAKPSPTDADLTDALARLYPDAVKAQAAAWREAGLSASDAQSLLELVRERKESLRAKGLSAWTYEKRLERVVASYAPPAAEANTTTAPAAMVPSVDKAEVDALRAKLKDVESQGESAKAQASQALTGIEKLQAQTQERLQTLQTQTTHVQEQVERLQSEAALRAKAADEAEKARSEDREAQREEARLLKQLVEDLQEGQKRLEAQLAAVDKKAETKRLDDQELRDSLTLMRKDLRDNSQDVSVLKQKVEKLMAPEKSNAKPLDKALGSKWLPGAAVLIAIGAVAIAASK